MKKRLFVLLLAAVLCLTGCGKSDADRLAELGGRWVTDVPMDRELLETIYGNMDLYEEEIALCSGLDASFAYFIEFRDSMTYRQGVDVNRTRERIQDLCRELLECLYQGRSQLKEVYGIDFEPWSREEFQDFYVELYSLGSYEELIRTLAEGALDYNAMAAEVETGTFRFSGEKIWFKTLSVSSQEVYTLYEILEDGRLSILVEGGEKELYRKEG